MTKVAFRAAFAAGLAVVAWAGAGLAGGSWIPLVMTALIAGAYLLGALELHRFRAATTGLRAALEDLSQPPAALADWLDKVPAGLRQAVHSRVGGERGGMPGPALTPYLVGLLVMLGMLGTFLGMVVTFKGAVFALEGSADLQAIRAALAEPIRGLGLAFGTSVAGVAASAMLGLMSAVSRRERLEVARHLDRRIATVLRPFSAVHQREEAFKALQAQAQGLPKVTDALQALIERLDARSRQLDQHLLDRHAAFQREATLAYAGLARDVGTALQESAAAGARAAGDAVGPAVERTMTELAQQSQRLHARLGEVAQAQVAGLLAAVDERLAGARSDLAAAEQQRLTAWTQALQAAAGEFQAQWRQAAEQAVAQQQALCNALERAAGDIAARAGAQAGRTLDGAAALLAQSEELVRSRTEAEARWLEEHRQRMDQLASLWRAELAALRREEGERGQAAVERLDQLQAAAAHHLAALGAALEAPITRLLHTAAEVPQAAAGVIAQLREQVSRSAERDNLALQERTALLEQLGALLQSVNAAAGEQRAAAAALVEAAGSVLEQAGTRFARTLDAQAARAGEMAAHIGAGAVELTAVAEAFQEGVQQFQASSDRILDGLVRIEASLTRSTARSDEQLAYYVAQAREVIDLSIASQQGVVDSLRQLQGRQAALAAESEA